MRKIASILAFIVLLFVSVIVHVPMQKEEIVLGKDVRGISAPNTLDGEVQSRAEGGEHKDQCTSADPP